MIDLISNIVNKNYNEAKDIFENVMSDIRERKLHEVKKIIQAESSVVDLSARREQKNIENHHKKFMDDLRSRSSEHAKTITSHVEAGKFPFKVGTRFTTEHDRKNGKAPWRVTGYYMDHKSPNQRYGYHVERGEGEDAEKSMHMIRDPKLEKIHGKEKWDRLQAGTIPFSGPQKVDEEEILDEASRFKIVRARFRGGKLQRRKKVSTQTGFTFRGGKMTRMSPSERRKRKMGQRKGKLKRKAKLQRALIKRKRTMRRRKALGL